MNLYENKKEKVLSLNFRKELYNAIQKFPGMHFRELQRKISIGTGNLDYHLNYLERLNLIKIERSSNKRIYPLGLNEVERKILGILRQKNFRKIIIKILMERDIDHKGLVNFLNISPSSVSWYVNKLVENNIIIYYENSKRKKYKLKNEDEILKVISTYKESFIDKLVDNFIESWEK